MIRVSLIRRKHYRDKLIMLSSRKKLSSKVKLREVISANNTLMRLVNNSKIVIPSKFGYFRYYIANDALRELADIAEYENKYYFNSFSNADIVSRTDSDLSLMMLTEYVVNANCDMNLFNKNYRDFLFKFKDIIDDEEYIKIDYIYQNSELFQS